MRFSSLNKFTLLHRDVGSVGPYHHKLTLAPAWHTITYHIETHRGCTSSRDTFRLAGSSMSSSNRSRTPRSATELAAHLEQLSHHRDKAPSEPTHLGGPSFVTSQCRGCSHREKPHKQATKPVGVAGSCCVCTSARHINLPTKRVPTPHEASPSLPAKHPRARIGPPQHNDQPQ